MGSNDVGKTVAAESILESRGEIPPLHLSINNRAIQAEAVNAPNKRETVLTVLPPRRPQRWGIRMKANVVDAVRQGQLSLTEVCERYELSSEEYLSWQRSLERFGLAGLRQRHIQSSTRHDAGGKDGAS